MSPWLKARSVPRGPRVLSMTFRTPDLSNVLKIENKPPKGLILSDYVCNFAMSVITLLFVMQSLS